MAQAYQYKVTYRLLHPTQHKLLDQQSECIALSNRNSLVPTAMRTTLWSGLLKTVAHNQNRQQPRIRLFETGLRFEQNGDAIDQQPMLAGVVVGNQVPENWVNGRRTADFFDVKGELESLFKVLGIEIQFLASQHPALHPGQTAELLRDGEHVGWLGTLHPQVQKNLELNGTILMFELFL